MPDTTPTISIEPETFLDDTILSAVARRFESPPHSTPSRLGKADRAEYLAMLRGEYPAEALPDDQAHGLLDALWSIMVAFVDLGFPPCGQVSAKKPAPCDKRDGDALYSSHQSDMQNNKAAHMNAADGRES